jgi:hypothetical protein
MAEDGVEVRLSGDPALIDLVLDALAVSGAVVSTNGQQYPNRRDQGVRVYARVRPLATEPKENT